VRKFLDTVVPSEADILARQGFEWEVNDQPAMAENMYRAALEKKADHYPSQVALGRVLLSTGKIDEALSILENIPEGLPERSTANALIASAEFQRFGSGQNEADLKTKITNDPGDVASHFALANLLAAEERYIEALDEFLEVVRRDRSYNDDAARKAMLALFTTIGEDQSLVREYRQKLANVLF
jgi:putative thioredoxin